MAQISFKYLFDVLYTARYEKAIYPHNRGVLLNFQVGLFTAAVFWMFDAPIALNPGGKTSQTDHIYSPPQTWGDQCPQRSCLQKLIQIK